MVCELAFRKHFVSLACQVGRQSLWQVPCPMYASTLEWEITCKESHVLFFVKHFKTGHLHLSSCMGMEFCRIPSEHLVPTHSHSLGQDLFPTEPLTVVVLILPFLLALGPSVLFLPVGPLNHLAMT